MASGFEEDAGRSCHTARHGFPPARRHKHLPPPPPSLVGWFFSPRVLSQRKFVQADILDGRPDDCQATGLGREDIDLIGTLAHIAEQAFNGIRGLNVPMQTLRHRLISRVHCKNWASQGG